MSRGRAEARYTRRADGCAACSLNSGTSSKFHLQLSGTTTTGVKGEVEEMEWDEIRRLQTKPNFSFPDPPGTVRFTKCELSCFRGCSDLSQSERFV